MFCAQCGKQIPNDAKFCGYCGAKIPVTTYTAPPKASTPPPKASTPPPKAPSSPPKAASTGTQTQKSAENGKIHPLATIVLCIVVFLAAQYFFGGTSSTRVIGTGSFNASSGESFQRILPENVSSFRLSHFKLTAPDTASYIKESSDGTICLMEFGYSEDVVREVVTTLFIPTTGWDYSRISNYTANVELVISELRATHGFVDGNTFLVGDNEYIAVQICMRNMDKSANIQAAVEKELISLSSGNMDSISMYRTEQTLRDDGYAKK